MSLLCCLGHGYQWHWGAKVTVLVNPSLLPSVAPGDSNLEEFLHTLEVCMHIAIEVVCRLRMAQEMRSLTAEVASLVDFLLNQILSLKEVIVHMAL
jgi:hypothetical protein